MKKIMDLICLAAVVILYGLLCIYTGIEKLIDRKSSRLTTGDPAEKYAKSFRT